jgi:hypothetical protein
MLWNDFWKFTSRGGGKNSFRNDTFYPTKLTARDTYSGCESAITPGVTGVHSMPITMFYVTTADESRRTGSRSARDLAVEIIIKHTNWVGRAPTANPISRRQRLRTMHRYFLFAVEISRKTEYARWLLVCSSDNNW